MPEPAGTAVPGRGLQSDRFMQERPGPEERQREQDELRRERIPESSLIRDRRLEFGQRPGGDDLSLPELPDRHGKDVVDDDLPPEEQREGDEESDLCLEVEEKRHARADAGRLSSEERQQQEGKPGEQHDDRDAPAGTVEQGRRQAGPEEHPVERATRDQG